MKYYTVSLLILVATFVVGAEPILKVGESTAAPKDGFADFEELNKWAATSSFGGGTAVKLKIAGTDVFYADRMFTSGRRTSELAFYTEGADGHLREFLMVPIQLKEYRISTENDQILVKCFDSENKNWSIAMTITKWMLPRESRREQEAAPSYRK